LSVASSKINRFHAIWSVPPGCKCDGSTLCSYTTCQLQHWQHMVQSCLVWATGP